jgi:histone deacetylase 6
MKHLPSREATEEELLLVHSQAHISLMQEIVKRDDLSAAGDSYNSIYFHPKTYECATLAAGSVLQVVDEVLNGRSRSGTCIVRPPGHHCLSDEPHGFCIFNNVAVAAQYAIKNHGLDRVLIIDWDIHHGNGTQQIFEEDPKVLYISIHRYDYGNFFPRSKDADYTEVGQGAGRGFNVNIPWNKKAMTDMEYVVAMQNIILPIAYEFNPQLVIVSAGFDAAIGDQLGGCKVTPEAYGHFTQWLSTLANGKIILVLEGGYNVNSISHAMSLCTKALLGDPLPMIHVSSRFNGINSSALESLQNVMKVQEEFWKCLKFNKKLPDFDVNENKLTEELMEKIESLKLEGELVYADDSGNSRKSGEISSNSDEPGPSSSRNVEKKQTLTDFLNDNRQALDNEEMFAIVPLKYCPHLALLTPEKAPEGKY